MLRFLHPKWLVLHLFVWGSAVAMVFLGRWQWDVGHAARGDLRNYAYAGQWLIFAAFAIFLWVRVLRDAGRPPADPSGDEVNEAALAGGAPADRSAGPTYRGYVMPQSDAIVVDDPEMAAYNAYLTALAEPSEPSAATHRIDAARPTEPKDAAQPASAAESAVPAASATPASAAGSRARRR
ncbi:MAG: hypothetical protein M3140_06595 [Actinomycetota bacterium]|nr:hypothetical protein [Actinomycetota bacterium]